MKIAAFFVAALLVAAASAFGEPSTQIIATSEDTAPDGIGTFFTFDLPSLNDAGQMVFKGIVATTSIEEGLFRGDGVSPLLQLARYGKTTPSGGTYESFSNFGMNAAGQVAFTGSSTTTGSGLYRSNGAAAATINRDGQSAPGGGTFAALFHPAINNSGHVVFEADIQLAPSSDADALFYYNGVSTTQIVREGQSPPTGGGNYDRFSEAVINDTGQVTFRAEFSVVTGEDTGIYRYDGSSVIQIVRDGDAAPVDGTFNDFRGFTMNSSGLVVFTATMVGSSNGVGIFSRDGGGGLVQVARAGDSAPDGNGTLGGFSAPALNDSGQIAFVGDFIAGTSGGSTDNEGIFRRDSSALVQTAREGQTAPDGNGSFSSFEDPALNNTGQIAFLASLRDTIGGTADDRGLFLFDDARGLLQIAREGDALLGSTITSLAFNDSIASDDHDPSGLNNVGQVAYRFTLADNRSGIALWSISGSGSTPPGTATPPIDPNAALKASLSNKIKKLKKKAKAAKKKKAAAAKKFKTKIRKLSMQLAAL